MPKQQVAIARCGDRRASSTSSRGGEPCDQPHQTTSDQDNIAVASDGRNIIRKLQRNRESWNSSAQADRKSSSPIKTRIVGKRDAMFVPLLKLALKASSRLSYMHAMRREHTPNSKFLRLVPSQAFEARMNLASPGGPIVRLRARVGSIKHVDKTIDAMEKGCKRTCIILR